MKKIRNIIVIGFAVFFLSACQEIFYGSENQAIRFRASAERNIGTKTSYSKEVDENTKKERIDWVSGDKVDVFMYYSYKSNDVLIADWEDATYEVVNPTSPGEKGEYISEGHLSGVDNGGVLRWKGDSRTQVSHYFYSVYPTGAAVDRSGSAEKVILTFNLPPNSDNMDYAYMAAAHKGAIETTADAKHENAVDLDYYPMVTTIYVTLINNTNSDKVVPVQLTSTQPLYGNYEASLSNGRFYTSDTAEEAVDNNNQSSSVKVSVAGNSNTGNNSALCYFCIRPREYKSEEVSLWINGTEHKLKAELDPCHKYNITVTITENGVEVDQAVAQFILAILNNNGGGNNCYQMFEAFFKQYFGFETQDDFNNKFWNDNNGKKGFNSSLGAIRSDNSNQFKDFLETWFPGDTLRGLLNAMQNIESVTFDADINKTLCDFKESTNLNKFFPKLKSLTLFVDSTHTIYLTGFAYLNSVKILGSNGTKTVFIKGCPELTDIDISAWNPNDTHKLTVDQCSKLETVTINQNNKNQIITITNCNDAVDTQ